MSRYVEKSSKVSKSVPVSRSVQKCPKSPLKVLQMSRHVQKSSKVSKEYPKLCLRSIWMVPKARKSWSQWCIESHDDQTEAVVARPRTAGLKHGLLAYPIHYFVLGLTAPKSDFYRHDFSFRELKKLLCLTTIPKYSQQVWFRNTMK